MKVQSGSFRFTLIYSILGIPEEGCPAQPVRRLAKHPEPFTPFRTGSARGQSGSLQIEATLYTLEFIKVDCPVRGFSHWAARREQIRRWNKFLPAGKAGRRSPPTSGFTQIPGASRTSVGEGQFGGFRFPIIYFVPGIPEEGCPAQPVRRLAKHPEPFTPFRTGSARGQSGSSQIGAVSLTPHHLRLFV